MTSIETLNQKLTDILPQPFEWIAVASGTVTFEDASDRDPAGSPAETVAVKSFVIGKYAITNAQYAVFASAEDGYRSEAWWDFSEDARQWRRKHLKTPETAFEGDKLPRTNVSWFDAVAFTRWLSQRTSLEISLPSESQWQHAAQGDDHLLYPWGNEWRANACVHNLDNQRTAPVDVTDYAQGDSPFGVRQMAGNVWEWCLNSWGSNSTALEDSELKSLRGGSWWFNNKRAFRTINRGRYQPDALINNYGFRIVPLATE